MRNSERYCVKIYRRIENNHNIVILGKIRPKNRQNIYMWYFGSIITMVKLMCNILPIGMENI